MGFSVIFLHRSDSHKPFLHHLKPLNLLLQDLEMTENQEIQFKKQSESFYNKIFMEYHESKDNLLLVDYFSVTEYLHLLIGITKLLNPHGQKTILFLAAAVSDFYLPADSMAEHKIQSGNGDLELCLKPVPKLIKLLKKTICPDAFIVSFKLETDDSLLLKKAKTALEKYGHDLVVSNCLATRKNKLILLDNEGEEVIEKHGGFIEQDLIERIVQKYNEYAKNK